MILKELIVIPNVLDRLKSPPKIDKRLGPSKYTCVRIYGLKREVVSVKQSVVYTSKN